MNNIDHKKIIEAGFKIVRRDYERVKILIKKKDHPEHWKDLGVKFESRAQLDHRMEILSNSAFFVED